MIKEANTMDNIFKSSNRSDQTNSLGATPVVAPEKISEFVCPECGSNNLNRHGKNYVCNDCLYSGIFMD